MEILTLFFLFIFGLFIGSFLLVLADRLPRSENVLVGRSYCESCKKSLSWYELLPVLSYVVQKGKCRNCHVTLSPWYPVAELTTALLFVLVGMLYPLTAPLLTLYVLIITCVLLVIFIADWKYGIIPFPMVAIGVFTTTLFTLWIRPELFISYLFTAIVSGLFFFAIFYLTQGKGMGFGDVVYAFFMGLFLGFPGIIIGLYIAFLTGAGVSLILIILKKKKLRGDTIAFGPFLVAGTLIAFLFENYFITLFNTFFKI